MYIDKERIIHTTGQKRCFGPFIETPGCFIQIHENSVKYVTNGILDFTGHPIVPLTSTL